MKKRLIFVLIIILLISLCSCAPKKDTIEYPVQFYYRSAQISYNSEEGIITPETREGVDHQANLLAFINYYLSGPVSENLVSPFPNNTKAITVTTNKNLCRIVLSDQIASLNSSALIVACACLSKTVMEHSNINRVEICAENELIMGRRSIIMDKNNMLFYDDVTNDPQ